MMRGLKNDIQFNQYTFHICDTRAHIERRRDVTKVNMREVFKCILLQTFNR